MSGPIDLSQYKNKASDKPSLEDLTPEQQEALDKMSQDAEPPKEKVETAFLVTIKDGHVQMHHDLADASLIEVRRPPSPDDITSAIAIMERDIVSQMSAQHTAMMMSQIAQQQMQVMQNQRLAAGLNLPK